MKKVLVYTGNKTSVELGSAMVPESTLVVRMNTATPDRVKAVASLG